MLVVHDVAVRNRPVARIEIIFAREEGGRPSRADPEFSLPPGVWFGNHNAPLFPNGSSKGGSLVIWYIHPSDVFMERIPYPRSRKAARQRETVGREIPS